MAIQVSNPTVTINNEVFAIVANSCSYTEGFGEQEMEMASAGGDQTEQVFIEKIETKFSMFKIEFWSDIEKIKAVRKFKANKNQNLILMSASNADGILSRTFSQASLINDYEVGLGSDTKIALEFKSNPAT